MIGHKNDSWKEGVEKALSEIAMERGVTIEHLMEEARTFSDEQFAEMFRSSGMPVAMDDITVFDGDL